MAEVTTETVLNVIEILKNLKTLLTDTNPYLPIYSALGGAFIGAVSTFIPTSITNFINNRRERKSLTFAIYAEISATVELISLRGYVGDIKSLLEKMRNGSIQHAIFQIIVPEDYCIIYKNNVTHIGKLDPNLQVSIAKFYQLLEATIQDVKPGGLLNQAPQGVRAFEELLFITEEMLSLGKKTMKQVEKTYHIKKKDKPNN